MYSICIPNLAFGIQGTDYSISGWGGFSSATVLYPVSDLIECCLSVCPYSSAVLLLCNSGEGINSSARPTLADYQSLLSLCPPPVYLFLTQSSVRKLLLLYGERLPRGEQLFFRLSIGAPPPGFPNNNAFGQFDGYNKQRFILPISFLNKPALYCFSFELPLLLYT